MGQLSHGQAFARKLHLDLSTMPLLLDHGTHAGAAAAAGADDFPLYAALGMFDAGSLLGVYQQTMTAQTLFSAARGLASERVLPTYDSGGSLTRLGGTFVVMPEEAGNEAEDSSGGRGRAQLTWSHVDTKTGEHATVDNIVRALEEAAAAMDLRAQQ